MGVKLSATGGDKFDLVMKVKELIAELEKIDNKDLPVRCSNQFMDVHIRDVKIEKNSFGGYTDEFVNVY